jgi:hypothetical protein
MRRAVAIDGVFRRERRELCSGGSLDAIGAPVSSHRSLCAQFGLNLSKTFFRSDRIGPQISSWLNPSVQLTMVKTVPPREKIPSSRLGEFPSRDPGRHAPASRNRSAPLTCLSVSEPTLSGHWRRTR